jgi:hypothetical protein
MGEDGRDPHDRYGRDPAEVRREGNSLRAMFFRWKDEIFPPDLVERAPDRRMVQEEQRAIWVPLLKAMRSLEEEPMDGDAYRHACQLVRPAWETVRQQGFDAPSWKDPPSPGDE